LANRILIKNDDLHDVEDALGRFIPRLQAKYRLVY
jgi:hypothetical protein